jgi:hypothetical protein
VFYEFKFEVNTLHTPSDDELRPEGIFELVTTAEQPSAELLGLHIVKR